MTIFVLAKASVVWLFILMLAMLNGVLREKTLVPAFGTRTGLVVSGVTLSLAVVAVAFVAAPWYGALSTHQWLGIGVFWLLLTLAFEFAFGRLVQHKTWTQLLMAYTFQGGNLWTVVLFVTFIAPWIAARIRGMS